MAETNQLFELCVLLTKAGDAAVKTREKELEQYGITVPKDAVLRIVRALGEEATPAEISRWMIREDHSVSEILSRMEDDGLVRRIREPGRKKGVKVALTDKGEQAHLEIMNNANSTLAIFGSLTNKECRQLKSLLTKVLDEALNSLESARKPALLRNGPAFRQRDVQKSVGRAPVTKSNRKTTRRA